LFQTFFVDDNGEDEEMMERCWNFVKSGELYCTFWVLKIFEIGSTVVVLEKGMQSEKKVIVCQNSHTEIFHG